MTEPLSNKQLLLLLIYSGFTTRQIYRLFPDFEKLVGKKHILIERLEACRDRHIQAKVNTLKTIDIHVIEQQLITQNIHAVSIDDFQYPHLLKQIYDPPLILFCRGKRQLLKHSNTLAIVGSRVHTQYTNKVLSDFMPHFAKAKLTIVSGLAKGADALAHEIAIKNGCATIGVLGFGHLHHYPRDTRYLRDEMEKYHITISEYPPFVPPAKFRFPERNRIISGLSKGVFITEAKERSGALITVDQALQQNRNVYVLPGDIYNPYTKGNLLRIQEGAEIILSEKDIMKDYCQ